jgi:hypothetical protein
VRFTGGQEAQHAANHREAPETPERRSLMAGAAEAAPARPATAPPVGASPASVTAATCSAARRA